MQPRQTCFALLFTLALPALSIRAQDAPPPPGLAALPPLDQLLAPVALYPDPLIGLVLAASTDTGGLQTAAAYLAQGGDPGQIAAQPWSDGVKGLAHYPDVLKWMNDNMPWTTQLGQAFASQPAAVMGAVQDLRARARASGALTSTPQQTVVADGDVVAIEPAQEDEIYVPLYDPDAVYFAQAPGYWGGPFLTFGVGYPMGIWLGFDFDWYGHRLWAGDWYAWRRAHGGWGHPYNPRDARFAGFAGHARAWTPAPGPRVGFHRSFAAPRPMAGTPARPAANHAEAPSRAEAGHRQSIELKPVPGHAEAPTGARAGEARPEHPGPGGHPAPAHPAPKPPVRRPAPRPVEHREEEHKQ